MCGFVGIINLNGEGIPKDQLRDMTALQKHRGPDETSYCLCSFRDKELKKTDLRQADNKVYEIGLGFNRLSIIDTSKAGSQPMVNQDNNIVILYNGEIYNTHILKQRLLAMGIKFHGTSDTEVILYLYQEFGIEKTLEMINGMFSIFILDLRSNKMFLARDRSGIKPIYIYKKNNTILFSSEIKSFLAYEEFIPEINSGKIDEFLMFRYVSGTETLFKNVSILSPGSYLDISNQSITNKFYWAYSNNVNKQLNFTKNIEKIERLLDESVSRQLISDVELGCQLSGGIDSSLINIFAQNYSESDMNSFSVVFNNSEFSEQLWIDKVADLYKLKSYKFNFEDDYFINKLMSATWHMDLPINHPNSLGLFMLAEKSKKFVSVMLSGEGADEVFGGYSRVFYSSLRRKSLLLKNFINLFSSKLTSKFSENISSNDNLFFILSSSYMNSNSVSSVFPQINIDKALEERVQIFNKFEGGYLDKCLNYDFKTYLPELLLRQDKMTMAHSVENRVPFLDEKILDARKDLPAEHLCSTNLYLRKIISKNTKKILKKISTKYFSNDFTYRSKSGFGMPLQKLFNHPKMIEQMNDNILPSIKERSIFQSRAISDYFNNLQNINSYQLNTLWSMITFELWCQKFIDLRKSN